jgi:hypothetical protein
LHRPGQGGADVTEPKELPVRNDRDPAHHDGVHIGGRRRKDQGGHGVATIRIDGSSEADAVQANGGEIGEVAGGQPATVGPSQRPGATDVGR